MRKLITNARVVSPDLDLARAAVLIEGDRIEAVIEGTNLPSVEHKIDAAGKLLIPGFIDIHSHGADGSDVCDDSLDALRHIARRKLQEGVTTWLPTTLTQPREKLKSIVAKIATFREEGGLTRCPGMHVEGPFINKERAGAQNPQYMRAPDFAEVEELHAIVPALILSLAPEMPGALELIGGCKALGITCSAAHTSATAAQIFAACDAGLTHLTHYGNAMTPLHHREIGVIGAGMVDDRLMIELISDLIHLSPDMLRLVFSTIPIDRLMMITDSVAASWIVEGEVDLGGLPVVVKDKVARLKDGGALAGSTLLANEGFRNLVGATGLPLHEVIKVTSWNQARSLGLEGLGKVVPGFYADLVLLNDDYSVAKTIVGGEER
ncbi:N-acetylglucosamine-6-phosphate deacetylase [Luteolibacter flavescens]|uniref:N-acetylglucosamine-6-phosphate deacetylase n=1 Tax=Luteolibacter flavescens TaxID=1859460 RepID=A0ABT3FUX7_9BACT|nr:N-acetylglucosamine-6-phosphate deacetylase [Luteolibacter flavescens]MCW1887394.1 N-acetylglucosamine-6-phosphate deacetylase [Luteolibacter flavescens]